MNARGRCALRRAVPATGRGPGDAELDQAQRAAAQAIAVPEFNVSGVKFSEGGLA